MAMNRKMRRKYEEMSRKQGRKDMALISDLEAEAIAARVDRAVADAVKMTMCAAISAVEHEWGKLLKKGSRASNMANLVAEYIGSDDYINGKEYKELRTMVEEALLTIDVENMVCAERVRPL